MENTINQDWSYYRKEIEVYRLVTTLGDFYIPIKQGEIIKEMLGQQEGKDRCITIGDVTVRLFLIQGLIKEKKKFFELPDAVKTKLLEDEEVFTREELAGFSKNVLKGLKMPDGGRLLNE